jgi:hypothetical protein
MVFKRGKAGFHGGQAEKYEPETQKDIPHINPFFRPTQKEFQKNAQRNGGKG